MESLCRFLVDYSSFEGNEIKFVGVRSRKTAIDRNSENHPRSSIRRSGAGDEVGEKPGRCLGAATIFGELGEVPVLAYVLEPILTVSLAMSDPE